MPDNQLFYGDNLDVLRRHIKDDSVDLVYLDPPFKSDQNYNVLFQEQDGSRAAAQIKAFGDTWRWDQVAERTCLEVIQMGGKISVAIQALRQLLGSNWLAKPWICRRFGKQARLSSVRQKRNEQAAFVSRKQSLKSQRNGYDACCRGVASLLPDVFLGMVWADKFSLDCACGPQFAVRQSL